MNEKEYIRVIQKKLGKHLFYLHHPDHDLVTQALLDGSYDTFESSVMRLFVRPGDLVLDVGAHVGYYTLLYCDLVGSHGKVIAVEPDPVNFHLLRNNLQENNYKNALLVQAAVLDFPGMASFKRTLRNSGDSRIYLRRSASDDGMVAVATLDSLTQESVAFLKIDTQGREVFVLEGAKRILSQERLVMLIEFWPYGIRESGRHEGELLKLLEDFTLYHVNDRKQELTLIQNPLSLVRPNTQDFINLLCIKG